MSTNKKLILSYSGRYGFWRLLNIIVPGFLIFGGMFTFNFIYQNIYSNIADANAIISLKSNLTIFDLDLTAYEKATIAIKQKTHLEEIPNNIRNIFYYNTSTQTYANTSTKP